jgi:hydrogenase expression/formation protein HypC
MGKVSFGGIAKDVCLAYVPEAQVGDFVIVHAGFALNCIDEAEAMEVFKLLREMGALEDEVGALEDGGEAEALDVPGRADGQKVE